MARGMFRRGRSTRVFAKRAVLQKNHWQTTMVHGGAGTQTATVVLAVDDVTNRSTHIQNGGVLKKLVVEVEPQTLAAGKYQCLLFKKSAGVAFADPIGSYFEVADPLTEDAILIRRALMGRVETRRIFPSAVMPIKFTCKWRGNSLFRDSDEVQIAINSNAALTFDMRIWNSHIM